MFLFFRYKNTPLTVSKHNLELDLLSFLLNSFLRDAERNAK